MVRMMNAPKVWKDPAELAKAKAAKEAKEAEQAEKLLAEQEQDAQADPPE